MKRTECEPGELRAPYLQVVTTADDVHGEQLEAEAERRCAEFREVQASLGPNDATSRSWMRAAVRRAGALRRLQAVDPENLIITREIREDMARLHLLTAEVHRLGRSRVASLAGRLLARGFGGRETLTLCTDHGRAHYGLTKDEIRDVVEWVAASEVARRKGTA